jgi:hypothetical protein
VKRTEAQRRAEKKYKAKKKASGLCVDCPKPAEPGVVRCADCLQAGRQRSSARNFEHRRIPTFDDFERIANRKSPCGWGYE